MRSSSFFLASLSFTLMVGCGSAVDLADDGETGGGDDTGTGADGSGADGGGTDTARGGDTAGGTDTAGGSDTSGGTDTATGGDTAPPSDTIAVDTTPIPDTPATCAPLGSGATDVYVDKRYTGTSTGTATCPFTTILAGLAAAASLSGTRTVHVAGATPALVYAESGSVVINHNTILLGDGPTTTTISASGTCGAGTCAVNVNGGATLDGFTVVSPGGDGILTSNVAPAPIVKNVSANGSKNNGILAMGPVELGPNIVANRNGGSGLITAGIGLIHVASGANAFDFNGANGINLENGGGTLKFDGGTASSNGFNGIRFGGAPGASTIASNVITGLTALTNKNNGVASYGGQSVKIRSSVLLTNVNYGLYFQYAAGAVLDIGLTTDAGGVTFGGATVATRNGKAGMYLCRSRGTATQPADSDKFAVCAPTQTSLAGCDTAPASYTDVAYAPATAGDPIVATACTVGP